MLVGYLLPAAEISWTNVAGGNWTAAANWSPNQVPTTGDIATITNVGNYIVTLDANATVSGLNLGGTGGSQTLIINGPALTLNGPGVISSNGLVSVLSGTLGGSGGISLNGVLNVFGGSLNGSGLLSVAPGGQITLNGNINLGTRPLQNAGRLIWTSGNITSSPSGPTISNLAGGTFDILVTDRSFSRAVTNAGSVRRMTGTGLATFNSSFSSSGTVEVQNGVLQLNGGTQTGSLTVAPGAIIWLAGAFELAPGSSVAGAGNVRFDGVINLNGTFNVGGIISINSGTVNFSTGCSFIGSPVSISGGTANFNTGQTPSFSSLTMSSGTIAGTDPITITGIFTSSGGTLNTTGAINANGGLSITGLSISSGILNNPGLATLNGGISIATNGVFKNLPGGTLNVVGVNSTAISPAIPPNIGGIFDNQGLVRFQDVYGTSVGIRFNNSGTVEIHSGLGLNNNITNTGVLKVAAGAGLSFAFGLHTLAAGSLLTNAGYVEFKTPVNVFGSVVTATNSTLAILGGANNFVGTCTFNGGTLNVSGGSVNFSTGNTLTPANLNLSGGTLTGSDSITVSGPMTWTGGTLSGAGAVNANGGLTLNGPTLILNGRTLNNSAAAIWSGGSIFSGAGSVISNAAGGIFDITFDGQTFIGLGGGRTFANAGLLRKTGGIGTATISDAVSNIGTIEVLSGTLAFGDTFVQAAGVTKMNGGNIAASGPLQIQGGILCGNGTINASVINSGRCAPGASPGLLQITGNYTQTGSGLLDIELGGNTPGSTFDQLAISGAATLGGSLNVTKVNSFQPVIGSTFRVLTFASRSGDFASFNDATDSSLNRLYDASGLTLAASNTPVFLVITRQGQQVQLSWPTNAIGYGLQFATNIPSTNWVDLPSSTNVVTLSPTQLKSFFRLVKP